MAIPDKVKLGWRIYSVIFGRRSDTPEGNTIWGEIDYERNTIFLNEDGKSGNQQSTLLHEIIHWIFYNSGQSKFRQDENLVECLTNHLMMIFKDNPDLARQIFGQE